MTHEEQIIVCEKRLLEAMKSGNIGALDELLHESLLFNIPTGETITKTMDLESYSSGIMTICDISQTNQIVTAIDDIATVTVTVDLKAKYADHLIDGKFKYLRVWKVFNNTWKIIAGSGFQSQ